MRQVLDWCDTFLVRFRAASQGQVEQPIQPPSDAPSSQSGGLEERLTPQDMASHNRLWTTLPHGVHEQWLDSMRYYWESFQVSHNDGQLQARGPALDEILRFPARTLVRMRGGRRRTQQAIRARLKRVATAARDPALSQPEPLPLRPAPAPRAYSPDEEWAASMRRAIPFASANLTRDGVRCLVSRRTTTVLGEDDGGFGGAASTSTRGADHAKPTLPGPSHRG